MSLPRPVRFPLLKLPFLCIEAVVKSLDIFGIIFFATISKKTRRIVKSFKIPLNGIRIFLSYQKWIKLGSGKWHFRNERQTKSFFDKYTNSRKYPLVLQKNAIPLHTRKTVLSLESYTDRNEMIPLKLAMEFLNEVFKCSVEEVNIYGDNLQESGDIGVRSTRNLYVSYLNLHDQTQIQTLNILLGNLEVTGTCNIRVYNSGKGFHCDPKLFKCKMFVFGTCSDVWVTRDILLQFEVPQLRFYQCSFSVEDIVSFVTDWFNSDNKKFEYLFIEFKNIQFSLEEFQTAELNPLPFSERTRVPTSESFLYIDFAEGLEIIRHDGLVATIHLERTCFLFYIWHDQAAIIRN